MKPIIMYVILKRQKLFFKAKSMGYTISKPQILYEVNASAPLVMVIKSNEKEKQVERSIAPRGKP